MDAFSRTGRWALGLAALTLLSFGCSSRPQADIKGSGPSKIDEALREELRELRAAHSERIKQLEARVKALESDLEIVTDAFFPAEEARIMAKIAEIDKSLAENHGGAHLSFSRTDLLPLHEKEFPHRLAERKAAGQPDVAAKTEVGNGGTRTKVLKIKVADKVDSVFWTAEPDACTLQIVFPSVPDGADQPERPQITVRLLRADGSSIPRQDKVEGVGISMMGFTAERNTYEFPASARRDAVAVEIGIDGKLFVERLDRTSPEGGF